MATAHDTFPVRRHAARMVFDVRDEFARRERRFTTAAELLGSVRLLVVAQVIGNTRTPLPALVELDVTRTPQGGLVWFGRLRAFEDGRAAMDAGSAWFRAGEVFVIRVESSTQAFAARELECELSSEVRLDAHDPSTPEDSADLSRPVRRVALEPGYRYPFRGIDPVTVEGDLRGGTGPILLRGTVLDPSGRGVPGATVSVELPDLHTIGAPAITRAFETDETGQWVLALQVEVFPLDPLDGPVASHPIQVRFALPGFPPVLVGGITLVRGREVRLSQTSIRGETRRQSGAGFGDVEIAIGGRPERARSDADGRYQLHFPPGVFFDLTAPAPVVHVTATAPDGEVRTHAAVTLRPRRPTRVDDFRFST